VDCPHTVAHKTQQTLGFDRLSVVEELTLAGLQNRRRMKQHQNLMKAARGSLESLSHVVRSTKVGGMVQQMSLGGGSQMWEIEAQ
jgi:hypothetical protein